MKMSSLKIISSAAALAGGIFLLSGQAEAACCVAYDYGNATTNKMEIIQNITMNDNQNTSDIKQHFTTSLNQLQLAVIEAIRLQTGQLTGNIRESTAATHNLADLQDDRAVAGRIEAARIDAIEKSASGLSTCNGITGTRSGSALSQLVQLVAQANSDQMTDWDVGRKGSGLPSEKGKDYAITARLGRHCSTYADESDVISGLCKEAGKNEHLQNADINITKSLYYAQDGVSHTLSQDHYDAAQTFIINAMNPIPQGPLAPGEASDPAGRELAAQRQAASARTSVGVHMLSTQLGKNKAMINEQVVNQDGQAVDIKDWAEDTAKHVLGYNNAGNNFPNGVGWNDWMELKSRSWFMNPTWAIGQDSAAPGQVQKDIANILAFVAYQNWEAYKLQEQNQTILATQLAILSEQQRGGAQR